MKYLFALLTLCLLACSARPTILQPPTAYKRLVTNTVALVWYDEEDKVNRPLCSGTWVSETEVLTADHCVKAVAEDQDVTTDKAQMHYVLENEVLGFGKEPSSIHLMTVEKEDAKHDLALLKIFPRDIPKHTFVKIADKDPEVGDRVWDVSTPVGNYFSYAEGYIARVWDSYGFSDDDRIPGQILQVANTGIWSGSSGSGLINERGELIGVNDFHTRMPATNFFIGVASIREFLAAE